MSSEQLDILGSKWKSFLEKKATHATVSGPWDSEETYKMVFRSQAIEAVDGLISDVKNILNGESKNT